MKSIYLGWIVSVMVLCFSTSNHALANAIEWELEVVKDDISVYTRAVVGSNIREAKVEAMIEKDVDNLVGFYLNPETCSSWIPSCRSAKLMEKKSEANLIVYREISIPWPFKNQEYILEQTISRTAETGEVTVKFNDLKDYPAGTKCCRRYKAINGYWKFTPTDNQVLVTYQVHFVPGGKFPASAINSEVPGMLIEMLSALKSSAGS